MLIQLILVLFVAAICRAGRRLIWRTTVKEEISTLQNT